MPAPADMAPVGLIAAIPEEIRQFKQHFEEAGRETIAGIEFRHGRLDAIPVVTAMTGMGKVNAAMTATLLLDRFACRALVFSGVAGGLDPSLAVGDVVIGETVVCHDYGAVTDGTLKPYQPGIAPLPGFPDTYGYHLPEPLRARLRARLGEIELPKMSAAATGGEAHMPKLAFGTILTGDTFINCAVTRDRLYRTFQAQAVEMEGAAVAQVAQAFDVPSVIVRALSDLAGAESHMDFGAFLHEAASVAAAVVRRAVSVV